MMSKRTENIRKDILVPFIFIILILTLLFVISASWLQEKHLRENTSELAKQYSNSFQNAVQKESELLVGLGHLLSRDPKLLALWQSQDRDALYQYAFPLFELFHRNHHITHFYFHQPDQHVFLRTHKQSSYGDKVDRFTLSQAVKSNEDSIGLEMGTVGLFVLRAVTPVKYQGQLLGYLELGKEIDDVTQSLSSSLRMDLIILVNKPLLEKSQYDEYIINNNLPDRWDSLADQVIVSSTIIKPNQVVNKALNAAHKNNQILEISDNEKEFHVSWQGLTDAAGHNVGNTLILHNVTLQKNEITRLWIILFILAILLTTLISYFYFQYLKRLETRLGDLVIKLSEEADEHIKAQRRLSISNRRLRELNSEMESYSYSLAHDLRAPLRAITSFSQILASEAGAKLSKEEMDFLERIVVAGKHMSDIIQDILKLANVAREELHLEKVNLSELAQQTIELLQASNPERKVEVTIADNLYCEGSLGHLGLLLDNLIGNAWKYTSGKSPAKIEINAMQQDGQTVFYVRDNGIGLDKHFTEKMFKPFHRLPNAKNFEGTGIGLAICKRIIDRHDGKIWVDLEQATGATIYFTIGVNTSNS